MIFIHEAYFIISYKATYEASFIPIEMANLPDDSDCEACGMYNPAEVAYQRRESIQIDLDLLSEQIYAVVICKKTGHTKRSPLCSGYKRESFFYTRPGGIKIRESISAAEPATRACHRSYLRICRRNLPPNLSVSLLVKMQLR